MYELVVIPLMNVLGSEEMTKEERNEALVGLQEALSAQLEQPVSWSEDVADDAEFQADVLDPYFIFALRAAAAWMELHDSLDGFEVGEEPWLHESLDAVDEVDAITKFPHLLQADDSELTVFVPVDFKEVFQIELGDEEEEEGEEEEDQFFFVASLLRLRAELDVLKETLGIEDGIEEQIEDIVPDPTVDPLAGPRYGWLVMSARVNEGLTRALPMVLYYAEDDEDDEDDEEGEDNHDNADN